MARAEMSVTGGSVRAQTEIRLAFTGYYVCLYFTVGVCCASGAPGRMRPAALCATAPTLVVLVSGY